MARKRKPLGAVIRMGASTFTLSFSNGDHYDLNAMGKKDFAVTVEFLKVNY